VAKFGIEDKDEPECLIVAVRSLQVEAVMAGYQSVVAFSNDPKLAIYCWPVTWTTSP